MATESMRQQSRYAGQGASYVSNLLGKIRSYRLRNKGGDPNSVPYKANEALIEQFSRELLSHVTSSTSPDAIKYVQSWLNNRTGTTLAVDGRWGPNTARAIQNVNTVTAAQNAPKASAPAAPAPRVSSGGGGGGGGDITGPAAVKVAASSGITAPKAPQTDEEIRAYLVDNFDYLAAFWDNKEIGPILKEAARGQWSSGRLQGALFKTGWWQRSSQSSRQWMSITTSDPGEANRRRQQSLVTFRNMASQMGLTLNTGQLSKIVESSLRLGWSQEEQIQALATQLKYKKGQPLKGDIAKMVSDVKQTSNEWYVPISDKSAFDWGRKVAMGQADQDNVDAYFRGMALGKFPSLKKIIEGGQTVKQFFDPYREQAAQLLETAPDQIDFMNDAKWTPVLDHVDDQGTRGPMTLSELNKFVKSSNEWSGTQQAQDQVAGLTQSILQTFGKVA